jgi:hypothetical protein
MENEFKKGKEGELNTKTKAHSWKEKGEGGEEEGVNQGHGD